MKLFRVIAVSVFVPLCLAFVVAQNSADKGSMDKKPAQNSMSMPMPTPSPEMQKLTKMMAGAWRTNETFEVSDMMPKGGTGSGKVVITTGPGGLSLIENYNSNGDIGAFAAHGVFWWDEKAQGYRTLWCDNTTPTGCAVANGLGNWEGGKVVFHDEQEMMGKKEAMKETITSDKPGSMTFVMEASEPGGPMKKIMTIQYTKIPVSPGGMRPHMP